MQGELEENQTYRPTAWEQIISSSYYQAIGHYPHNHPKFELHFRIFLENLYNSSLTIHYHSSSFTQKLQFLHEVLAQSPTEGIVFLIYCMYHAAYYEITDVFEHILTNYSHFVQPDLFVARIACYNGNTMIIQLLIEKHAHLFDLSCLEAAACMNHVLILDILLIHQTPGATGEWTKDGYETVFDHACTHPDLLCLKTLMLYEKTYIESVYTCCIRYGNFNGFLFLSQRPEFVAKAYLLPYACHHDAIEVVQYLFANYGQSLLKSSAVSVHASKTYKEFTEQAIIFDALMDCFSNCKYEMIIYILTQPHLELSTMIIDRIFAFFNLSPEHLNALDFDNLHLRKLLLTHPLVDKYMNLKRRVQSKSCVMYHQMKALFEQTNINQDVIKHTFFDLL